jgi:uncharacterized OB-fold protein
VTDAPAAPPIEDPDQPVRFMNEMVSIEYQIVTSPVARRFAKRLKDGVISGHKCPSCGMVFVPPRGYCPMCVIETDESHEVEVESRGTLTAFTILTPIQYYGQTEKEDYALASILLDGASGTVGQQRIGEIPVDKIRTGMRVEGVWAPVEERELAERAALGGAFKYWKPTGEPDVPHAEFADHVL